MKISGITVYEVKPRWIFVKITTDEGIEGWGEMISGTKTETVVAGAKEMGEYYRAFWQRSCCAAAAGAVLKPSGGNCAVLPL